MLKQFKKFKDLHKGEEVYIIADSSELRLMDLSIYDDKPAICFNRSYFIKEIYNRKNITYAHLIESFYFFKGYKHNGKKIKIQKLIKQLIKEEKIIFITNLTNFINFMFYPVNYIFIKLPSDLFTRQIYKLDRIVTSWSIKFAISLAIYMGFKKAYLIGVSFHSESLAHHWYDDIEITKFHSAYGLHAHDKLRNHTSHDFFFREAQKHIEIEGITVFEPINSYFKYKIHTKSRYLMRTPKSPYEMTDFADLIEFNRLEKLSLK
jgi:hypothetical protein